MEFFLKTTKTTVRKPVVFNLLFIASLFKTGVFVPNHFPTFFTVYARHYFKASKIEQKEKNLSYFELPIKPSNESIM